MKKGAQKKKSTGKNKTIGRNEKISNSTFLFLCIQNPATLILRILHCTRVQVS